MVLRLLVELLGELRVGLDQARALNLQLLDFYLHSLELLRHLIALLDASLELLADVDDHFLRALDLLVRVVRCT